MANNRRSERRPDRPTEEVMPELVAGVRLSATIEAHERDIQSLAFHPAGQLLASASRDSTVKLWEVGSGILLRPLQTCQDGVLSVAFDPTGQVLATGSSEVTLWDVTTRSLRKVLSGHGASVWSVAFDPTGRILASASGDGAVRLWDVARGKLLNTLRGQRSGVLSVAFDRTGRLLASASRDGTVKLWGIASGKVIHVLEAHRDWVLSVAFSSDGQTLASGGHDWVVRIWDVTSGNIRHTLEGHTNSVEIVVFSPDGRFLASKSADGTVRIWDSGAWETLAVISQLTNPEHWIPALALHPHLPLLATVGSEPFGYRVCRLIHLWRLDLDLLIKMPASGRFRPGSRDGTVPEIDTRQRAAEQRTRFEQAIYSVQAYVTEQKIKLPECFISYAWGVPEHERWVEKRLATDLQKAGIAVVLDRWENARVGASVSRFVQKIGKSTHVVVIGTPFYLDKYENKSPERGYVVAAEFDIVANRMLGTEAQKESVLPILLKGEKATSFPVLLHDRVYADFRKDEDYFVTAFDLILSLYGVAPSDPAVADLRESLQEPRLR